MQQVLLGAALLAALCWNLAHASEIKGLRLDSGATGTRAEVELDGQADYKLISLSGPDRLVLDLTGSGLARGFRLPAAVGIVKAVRTGHPQPGTTRIVFDLAAPVVALKPRMEPAGKGNRLVLEWPGDEGEPAAAVAKNDDGDAQPAAAAATPAQPEVDPAAASNAATARLIAELPSAQPSAPLSTASAPPPSVPTTVATGVPTRIATGVPAPANGASPLDAMTAPQQQQQPAAGPATGKTLQQVMRGRGMRPLIVAIDPGHGGQDPGAIGMNGKREKDVTLAIGRELARQINATPGLKAYMTRDSDVYIPLNRRAQMARTQKADIFVSIHADAAENRSASGASVYVLSLKGASSQRARWLADKENASDLIGGVPVSRNNMLASVLLDLTQSGHMKASEDAAGHVLDSLGRVGSARRVERANFAVLRTSDMPAMLVETAYISNPEEERRLTDPSYQRKVAGAVLDGINAYFTRQPPPGTLYAARAAAASSGGGAAVGGGSP